MKSFYAILIAVLAIACGGTTSRDYGTPADTGGQTALDSAGGPGAAVDPVAGGTGGRRDSFVGIGGMVIGIGGAIPIPSIGGRTSVGGSIGEAGRPALGDECIPGTAQRCLCEDGSTGYMPCSVSFILLACTGCGEPLSEYTRDCLSGSVSPCLCDNNSAMGTSTCSNYGVRGICTGCEAGTGGTTGSGGAPGVGGDATIDPGIGGVGTDSGIGGAGGEGGEQPELLNLTLQLAEDTPESRIVVSGSEELFAKYILRNPNTHDVEIISMILQTNGSVADFSSVRLTDCQEGGWEKRIDAPCIGEALCHFPEEYGSQTTIYGLFSIGERLRVPELGEVGLCMFAHMAEVQPTSVLDPDGNRLPRSGDIPNLRVGNMITNDADVVYILAPYEPPSMVLRKAEPLLAWADAEEPLHEGFNRLAQITISSTDQARPVGLQQVWLVAESSDPNMLTPQAAQTRLTIEHRSIDETVTWEWDGVTPVDSVGGHTNERGVFMWEESVPDTAYIARIMFYNDELATPEFNGLVGPLTVSLWANVQGVSPGSSITTRLTADSRPVYRCEPTEIITSSLTLFNGNGLLMDAIDPDSPIPWQGARVWWSDMSEGTGHRPMDWSDGAASPPIPSSPDYTNVCLVVGAGVGSVITDF